MNTVPDAAHALSPTGNLRRRLLVTRLMEGGAIVSATLAVVVLGILVAFTAKKGIGAISWTYLTGHLPDATGSTGGMGPAFLGSAELALMAGIMSLGFGVLTALFLTEFATSRTAAPVRLVLDLLAGLPTIITGVFVFALLVYNGGQSGFAGSLGLAIVMTPMVARASLEALQMVPSSWRDAADALGVSRWRTVLTVVLPGAASGIVTASILAVARGAGETAPLLFTTSIYGRGYQLNPGLPLPNVPMEIFTLLETGYPASVRMAWGAAFLLMIGILVVNVGARVWLRRSERKRGL